MFEVRVLFLLTGSLCLDARTFSGEMKSEFLTAGTERLGSWS